MEVNKESLVAILDKVNTDNINLNQQEALQLKEVYYQLTGYKVKTNCNSCLMDAFKIIRNNIRINPDLLPKEEPVLDFEPQPTKTRTKKSKKK